MCKESGKTSIKQKDYVWTGTDKNVMQANVKFIDLKEKNVGWNIWKFPLKS